MANMLDAVAGVGQFGFDPLGDFVEGRKARSYLDELKRAEQARTLTGAALGGDQNALRQLPGVDPNAFMSIQKYQQKDPASEADRIASLVNWADTPEKWQQAVQRLQASGHQLSPEELDFNNRGAMLAEYTTLKEQQALAGQDPASVREYQFAKQNGFTGSFLEWKQAGGGGGNEYGLNPIYGTDEQGNQVLFQPSKAGGARKIDFPPGFKPTPGLSFLNTGTDIVGVNKRTGAPGVTVPIDNTGKAKATEIGKGQGEATVSYQSISSKMPGLERVVGQLDKLADVATYTSTGRLIDYGRKELGMVPREAAIARTRYISMVDNQILPLLRDTFGAQFTEREGQSLKATLGDPNKTPAEKQAVLKSFIEQKRRDVEALATRAGISETSPPPSDATRPANADQLIEQANEAILQGADPAKVQQRLREQGIEADFSD